MKILNIMPSLDPKDGGPVEGLRQFSIAFRNKGVDVDVVCCDSPDAAWLTVASYANIYPLGPSYLGVYKFTPRLISWLTSYASRYDYIISHGIWQFNNFATWLALKPMKIPYFVFPHGMLDTWSKKKYPLKHLKKCLYWPWAAYPFLKDARGVLFTTEDEKLIARQSFGIYKANEVVTSYGIACPPQDDASLKNEFFSVYKHLLNKKIYLFMGRIHPIKGCDILLHAFADIVKCCPDAHLVMAGPDQTGWVQDLVKISESLHISSHVSWLGMLVGNLKWGAYYSAEIFCLPSHRENFGIVVAEALACGKPVLITNRVNIWREIEKFGAGFVDDDNIEGMRRNLLKWINLTEDEKSIMAKRAKDSFNNEFHISKAADSLIKILELYG